MSSSTLRTESERALAAELSRRPGADAAESVTHAWSRNLLQ